MVSKSFPKGVQSAAAKALPLWQFQPENSDATIQSFVRSLDEKSSSLKQFIDFQKGSGDYFYVNFWTVYSGVAKGGAPVDYEVNGGERLDISLNGDAVEECVVNSAELIQSKADQYARKYVAELEAINKVMTSILAEYKDWRRSMRSELADLKSYLRSRLSAEHIGAEIDKQEKDSNSPYNSKTGLWSDFRSWFQNTANTALGVADYFSATPGADHQLMPYPDRTIDDARFWDFYQYLKNRGYLKSELSGAFLRGFWAWGRPRLKSDFGEDKALGTDCLLCDERKSRGKFVEKHDACFGVYTEFICSKCLK